MTDAQGPFFQEGDTGKPTGATAVTAFAYTQATMFADIVRRLQNQHRSALWYKGLNADLLDSKHAAYLTTAVNETDVDHPDLNDTDPAAPTGGLNVKWQVSATQNSDDQTPVSAYVPFSSLAVVTIVSTDYVVITDTSDSNNPKRALVSDITALVAPADAQYLTLATNATLTNERVLTEGLGIDFADAGSTLTVTLDLGEIATGTPSGADTFVFVDADDQIGKRGTAAETLTALGAASSSTAVTAASAFAGSDKYLIRSTGTADRSVDNSGVTLDDSNNMAGIGTLASGATTTTVASAVAVRQIGVDSTDGPWKREYVKDFSTGGASATETLIDIPIPEDSQMQTRVEIIAVSTANAGRGTSHSAIIRSDNVGGSVANGAETVLHNQVDTTTLTVSYTTDGTNLRIQVADTGTVMRIAAFITSFWRTLNA